MYYKGLTGSQQFKINIDTSDIDYTIISNIKGSPKRGNSNFHCQTPEEVISNIFDTDNGIIWKSFGLLFSEPVITTDFSEYLLEHREILIASNLPRFGDIMSKYINAMSNKEQLNERFPKRTIYATLFLNAYINYPKEGMTFEEAFKLPDELIKFCKDIRLNNIPYEAQMEKLKDLREQAFLNRDFYNKEPDLATFYKIKSEMETLLNIEGGKLL